MKTNGELNADWLDRHRSNTARKLRDYNERQSGYTQRSAHDALVWALVQAFVAMRHARPDVFADLDPDKAGAFVAANWSSVTR